MEFAWLTESAPITLRDLLRLTLCSILFVMACRMFPRNAASLRILILAAIPILSTLPWLLSWAGATWQVPFNSLPVISLEQAVPFLAPAVWAAGVVLLLARRLTSLAHELRNLAALPAYPDGPAQRHLRELAGSISCAVPALKLGNSACSTSLGGNGTVILPDAAAAWDNNTLRTVLAHELVHINRRDDRWLLLSQLLIAVYWWMPWLRSLHSHFVRVVEESCDDRASELLGQPINYVEGLVNCLPGRQQDTTPGCSLPGPTPRSAVAMYTHHVLTRIRRFAGPRQVQIDSPRLYWCVTGILIAVIGLTGIQPVQQQTHAADQLTTRYSRLSQLQENAPAAARVHLFTELAPSTSTGRTLPAAQVEPAVIYPGKALRAAIEGEVRVHFVVNRDGSVSRARVTSSAPPGVFDRAALRAVLGSRYETFYSRRDSHTQQSVQPLELQKRFSFRLGTASADAAPALSNP